MKRKELHLLSLCNDNCAVLELNSIYNKYGVEIIKMGPTMITEALEDSDPDEFNVYEM
ncbi:hypothetical protein [Veillonella sp. Ser01]